MNVSCPECRSIFRIDPTKVSPAGVQARCTVCGAVWRVARDADDADGRVAALPEPGPAKAGDAESNAAPDVGVRSPAGVVSRHESEPEPTEPTAVESRTAGPAPVPTSPTVPLAEALANRGAEPRARPSNPYLNNTPELRARRLARALVSDLVAYNPQKREQGLRDGTLRQHFRDEIRKSWDEYVEQVGASVAESTPHFQDALNDVLAGGRRIF